MSKDQVVMRYKSLSGVWTVQSVLKMLKSVRCEEVRVGGAEFQKVTELNEDQQELIQLLGIQWPKKM